MPAPEDYLPPELLTIAGYDSVDSAALASIIAAVSPEYARAFALLESQRALRPADLAVGLNTSDAELDAILAQAGSSGATRSGGPGPQRGSPVVASSNYR